MSSAVSETVRTLDAHSQPVANLPWLINLHGFAFDFAGARLRHVDLGGDRYVRTHWFIFLFMPVVPLGIYLVSNPVDELRRTQRYFYIIHRKLKLRAVSEVWGTGGLVRLIGSGWLRSFLIFFGFTLALVAVSEFALWNVRN